MSPGAPIGTAGILVILCGICIWSGLLSIYNGMMTKEEEIKAKRRAGIKTILVGIVLVIAGMIVGGLLKDL